MGIFLFFFFVKGLYSYIIQVILCNGGSLCDIISCRIVFFPPPRTPNIHNVCPSYGINHGYHYATAHIFYRPTLSLQ